MDKNKQKVINSIGRKDINYSKIMDSLMEGCQVIGFDWQYLYLNDAAAKHGHRIKGELLGNTIMDMYPGIENTDMFSKLKICMEKRNPCLIENEFTYPDNNKSWFELRVEPVPDGIFILSIDISERKTTEQRIKYLNTALLALRNVNKLITKEKNREHLIQKNCDLMVENRGFLSAWILLLDEQKKFISAAGAGSKEMNSVYIDQQMISHYPPCVGKILEHEKSFALCETIIGGKQNCIPNRFSKDGKSFISRLEFKGKLYGVISAYVLSSMAYDPEEKSLFQELAGDISYALYSIEKKKEHEKTEEAFKKSEEKYRNLVDNSLIGIYQTHEDGKILFVNEALAQILEFKSSKEMISGNIINRYKNPEDRKLLLENLHKKSNIKNFEVELVTKKGNLKNVILSARLEGDVISGMVMDNTERKNDELKIKNQLSQLNALRNIDMAITSSLDIRVTLNVFLENVLKQLKVDAADVLLFNPNTQMLEYSYGVGFYTFALKYTNLHIGEGFAGRAAKERTIINIPDLSKEENSLKLAPSLAKERFVRYLAVPLIAKSHVLGVLEIFNRKPMVISLPEEWFSFLEALATQAAIAIENANLFNELQNTNLELSLAYDTTLEGWSKALDIRDKETEGHALRVTRISRKLAKVLGVKGTDLIHIRRGSLLHDIGKIGVPDSILSKSGPLSKEEWAIMKRHTVLAFELLSPISFLKPAIDIPYCHHEKWDGSGYPRELKGEQIPFAARIFAIVDVWDALSSGRPYRPAWPKSKIRKYLISESGKYFEPKIVDAFLSLDLTNRNKKIK
ncbi:MAG: GAF domain-containing protein [Actinobacteria bacterium]|nr:GAF domain-containing protein [Actinomycetota bacterium]